jgi:hypothetical protein
MGLNCHFQARAAMARQCKVQSTLSLEGLMGSIIYLYSMKTDTTPSVI